MTENLKYLASQVLPLERDTMDGYNTRRDSSKLYATPSGYAAPIEAVSRPAYFEDWRSRHPAKDMSKDADALASLLQPADRPYGASLAERIFGGQAKEQRVSLEHSLLLFSERARLHDHFMRDIAHRHLHMQELLFGARLHGNLDGYRRAERLEQALLQLDSEKRREELKFWQDTADLRDRAFDAAKEYRALRGRTELLSEVEYGGATDA